MTVVAFANVVGQARGERINLPNRRRRLSTVVARHRPAGRRFIVSVHRNGVGELALQPSDATVRLRADWVHTLVGPRDVVLITLLPSGGGGSGGGGGKGALGIGMAIASIALIALAPYAAPLIAGSLLGLGGAATGTLATAIQAGIVIGGLALGAAAQNSAAARSDKQRSLYSVAGGGNVPRPGARRPLGYGRFWSVPPLSQRDYFRYDGDTMVLTKRMTLGLGKWKIHTIKVGDATFWTETDGIVAPFNSVGVGDAASAAAIEFLYESASRLAVGDAIGSGSVAGQELPRPNGNPSVTPWFRLTPQGVLADQALLSWTHPAVYRTSSSNRQVAGVAGVLFRARRIDPVTGAVIGQPFDLLRAETGSVLSTTAIRSSRVVRLPAQGAYEISGANLYPEASGFSQENKANWDELTALKDDVRIRTATTEIVMQVRAGPGLTITAFTDISVEATRILPVWTGSAWIEQPTRKAVWALCDLVRNEYGLDAPDGFDRDKALYDAGRLTADDTFDGLLPEVSSYWEAAAAVLLPMRADPVKVGSVHSYVRDESSAAPRHVLTRRQIVRDSGSASFRVTGDGGDVIVEFDRDGDPRRPDEVRYSYGAPTRTPKRYKVPGISDGAHAYRHAKWLALVSVFRGAARSLTTEWDGRLIYPGDHVLSDLWYLKGKSVFGVTAANDNLLTLDADANLPTAWSYGAIRTRAGREWGILQMRGQGARGLELDAGDVAALTASTRLGLADVLARDTQDATTVVLGELVELQETYVVRSAIPADADHVRIEMLADDPRIWLLLGETVSAPAPVSADPLSEPLLPQISVLHAACQRIETGIEVTWSLSPARGARAYAVWLSYDGGLTREPLSNGAATAGRAPMRQFDGLVTVIAVAYGRTGLPGREVSTTFTTVAPVIAGSLVDISTLPPITYQRLDTAVQQQIDRLDGIQQQATAAAAAAQNALTTANGRLDNLRRALAADPKIRAGYVDSVMGDIRRDVSVIADATARNLGKLAELQDTMAAAGIEVVPAEGRVRIAALNRLETAVGTQITSLSVTLDALKGQIELYGSVQTGDLGGIVTSISVVQQRLDALAGTVTTLATAAQVTDLSNRISSAQQTIDGQAGLIAAKADLAVVNAQGTRLTQAETRTSALEGRVSSVVTAAGASTADALIMPRLIGQLGDVLGRQIGAIQQNIARAETSIAASLDDAGRSVGEIATRLVVLKGETTAQFESVTRAIADTNGALVQTTTLYDARFAEFSASLIEETRVRASADGAQTSSLAGAVSRIGAAEASLNVLGQTVATNQSSSASQFQGVTSRFGTLEANVSSLTSSTASADAALSTRIDSSNAAIGSLQAGAATEVQNRIAGDNALSSRSDQISARAENANAGVSSVSQALASTNQSLANVNFDLVTRSNAGTAFGRFGMNVASAPAGVSVRIAAVASTDTYGQQRNAGWYLDLLPNGTSRFVVDANFFALTANGGTTFPFQFDGQTLTVPSLRVTQSAVLPGAVSDRFAPLVRDIDCGATSTSWREIPGTAVSFTPDDLWASMFSASAQGNITAVGSNNTLGATSISFAVGVDGVPYGAPFGSFSQQAGNGFQPNIVQTQTQIYNGPALFEITAVNQSRRISILYKFECSAGGSGKISLAQLKLQTTKR